MQLLEELILLPRTRKAAKILETKHYFTNKKCIRGHLNKRLTSNGGCRECEREDDSSPQGKLRHKRYEHTEKGKKSCSVKAHKYHMSEKGQKYLKSSSRRFEKKKYHIKKMYGLSLDQYFQILQSQNNQCSLCNKPFNQDNRKDFPHIDHDHKTGKIREILCAKCNAGLGLFKDNINILQNAIRYLRRYSPIHHV